MRDSRPATIEPLLMTPAETCKALSISRRSLYALTSPRGPLPSVPLGGAIRYSRRTLEKWIEQQEQAATGIQD